MKNNTLLLLGAGLLGYIFLSQKKGEVTAPPASPSQSSTPAEAGGSGSLPQSSTPADTDEHFPVSPIPEGPPSMVEDPLGFFHYAVKEAKPPEETLGSQLGGFAGSAARGTADFVGDVMEAPSNIVRGTADFAGDIGENVQKGIEGIMSNFNFGTFGGVTQTGSSQNTEVQQYSKPKASSRGPFDTSKLPDPYRSAVEDLWNPSRPGEKEVLKVDESGQQYGHYCDSSGCYSGAIPERHYGDVAAARQGIKETKKSFALGPFAQFN